MCAQIILPIDLLTRSKIIGRDIMEINTILGRYPWPCCFTIRNIECPGHCGNFAFGAGHIS